MSARSAKQVATPDDGGGSGPAMSARSARQVATPDDRGGSGPAMSAWPAQRRADREEPATVAPVRGTRVLERSLAMLFELAESDGALSTGELARRADLPPSTAYRLIDELDGHGLVERDGDGGLAPGLRLLELARRVEDRLAASLLEPARGIMRALAREHDETALLTAPAGRSAIGLDAVEPARPVRLSFGRWRAAPMYLGASGKVLLAFLPARAAERVLSDMDDAVTASGRPVDVERLRRELAQAREHGVVVTHGELDPGISGVAAPVLGPRGRLLAGLTLVGPTERVGPSASRLSAAVHDAAAAIGRAVHER